jgi:DNA-binding NarL/FixJ family response regulator
MIRLLIVDDQAMVRELLKTYLAEEPELSVVGEAKDGMTALEQAKTLNPDVVLMDIEMPEMDGIATTRMLLQHVPQTKVLVISSHYDDVYFARALRNGARGYLLKSTAAEELTQAIHAVQDGYLQFGSGVLDKDFAQLSTFASVEEVSLHIANPTQRIPSHESGEMQLVTTDGDVQLLATRSPGELENAELEKRLRQIEMKQTWMQWFYGPQEIEKEISRLKSSISSLQKGSRRIYQWNAILSLIAFALVGFSIYQFLAPNPASKAAESAASAPEVDAYSP